MTAMSVSGGEGQWLYGKWVQAPMQGRSRRSFMRFLEAAEGLLKGKHWHEVSVHEIVREAEASVGSFYNRFSDKAALLHCLDDRLGLECELTLESLEGELAHHPALVDDAPGIIVSVLIRLCEERRGIIRALDLAHKMSGDDSFDGLGLRFDNAASRFATHLASCSERFHAVGAEKIARAFKETFWLAREQLVYGAHEEDERRLHSTLLRHFEASLSA
ncbi:helix-turn-helix domain-containing protein [Terasakiella pusilla]|uniref:TetR/AcrR family transcriptional regulator n=1 Tax=Terasakiella pusilla TaxID=64973 RepID=UPI003AA9CD1F